MSLSSQGSHFQTAGGTCRWCGVKSRRRWPVCALPLLVHAFPLPRLCLCPFSLVFLSIAASSTAFPSLLLLHTLLFYTYLFSLCPSLSLLPWLLSFLNKMGRQENWWKIQWPMILLPFIIVLSPAEIFMSFKSSINRCQRKVMLNKCRMHAFFQSCLTSNCLPQIKDLEKVIAWWCC